jgi:hypothetical protein
VVAAGRDHVARWRRSFDFAMLDFRFVITTRIVVAPQ